MPQPVCTKLKHNKVALERTGFIPLIMLHLKDQKDMLVVNAQICKTFKDKYGEQIVSRKTNALSELQQSKTVSEMCTPFIDRHWTDTALVVHKRIH